MVKGIWSEDGVKEEAFSDKDCKDIAIFLS